MANRFFSILQTTNYSLLDRIFQCTDGRDGNFYRIAGMDIAGRFEAGTDARWCARRNDITGLECRALGEDGYERRDGEDKFFRRGILTDFVIDFGHDSKGIGGRIAQQDTGAHGGKGFEIGRAHV